MFLFLILSIYPNFSFAGIGIAVVKDDNHSSILWRVGWAKGETYRAEAILFKELMTQGYKKIYTLTGGKQRGHYLDSGYWVVVEGNHKNYKGLHIKDFGLGASDKSYEEAEKRAVSNLMQYTGGWNPKFGYRVIQKGTFKTD